jgi:2-polyprenyl-3-methyl-5-hydroxy-6-metoxy-1,4-benzoquinol methylase
LLLDQDRLRRINELAYDYVGAPKEEVGNCNLCGAEVFTTITHTDRYGYPSRTSACAQCGLAFLNPRLTEAGYAEFYERAYRPLVSAFHGRLINAETVEVDQANYTTALSQVLAPYLEAHRGSRLLDVGGSTGLVSERLGAVHGLRPLVIDPAPAEVERARERGLEAVVGTMETFTPEAGGPFGVALICQTIDHLLDIAGSLASVRDHLADDGILFVDIVDFRAAYLRAQSVEAATKVDHPYSLTEVTAEAYLARAGFEIVHRDYAADHLHIGYVCRPASPRPDALPPPDGVRRFFEEIRAVQNRPEA